MFGYIDLLSEQKVKRFLEIDRYSLPTQRRDRTQTYPILPQKNKSLPKKVSDYCLFIFQNIKIAAAANLTEITLHKNQLFIEQNIPPDFLEIFFHNKSIAEAIKQVFLVSLNIQMEFKRSACKISWEKDHPLVGFKPKQEHDAVQVQQHFIMTLIHDKSSTDIVFNVRGQFIEAHKIFVLKRCSFLETYAKHILPANTLYSSQSVEQGEDKEILEFDHTTPENFRELIFYCYTSHLSKEIAVTTVIELYLLADFMGFDSLVHCCKTLMIDKITPQNFLTYAFLEDTYKDHILFELFEWFLASTHNRVNFNLSDLTIEQVFDMYRWIRKYNKHDLCLQCMEELIHRWGIDATAQQLLQEAPTKEEDDNALREWFDRKNESLRFKNLTIH